jgi:micrococcal nuclease
MFQRSLWPALLLLPALVAAGNRYSFADEANLFKSAEETTEALVEKVMTADTIKLNNGKKIKLIGLKAPALPRRPSLEEHLDKYGFELEKEINPQTTLEEQAIEYVRNLLEGQTVRLEYDTQRKAGDALTLAYVFLKEDNLFVNAEILRQGFATLQLSPLNDRYAEQLRAAYREARQEQRGLQSQ